MKIAVLADTPLHAVLGNNDIGSRSADKIGNRGGSLEEGILLFNPGSASDKRLQPNHTMGTLSVANGSISGTLVGLD